MATLVVKEVLMEELREAMTVAVVALKDEWKEALIGVLMVLLVRLFRPLSYQNQCWYQFRQFPDQRMAAAAG